MTRKIPLIVVFVLLFASAAAAQQVVKVKGNRTPLRAEPATTSSALAYYQAGTRLQALELVNGWYRVRDPETRREGYIMATLVEVESGAAGAPPARPGAAQPAPGAAGRPRSAPRPPLGVRGIADVGAVWLTASESFKAVADTNMRVQFGGGVQIVNLWKRLYAEVNLGWSELSGSRAFVFEGDAYDLGIPVTMTFMPVEAGGGWRFPHGRRLHSYLGGGVTFMNYTEESDFADAEDDVSEVFTGFYVAGGIEVVLTKWLHLRGEARYTSLPDALGAGGVSADFDETNLGGAAVAVKLAIGE